MTVRINGTDHACWEDLDDATCMLPDGHDGPHERTPNNEIFIRFVSDDDRAAEDADLQVKMRKEER